MLQLKCAIINVEKREEAKVKQEENNVQTKDARRIEDPRDEVTNEVYERVREGTKIVSEESVNVKLPKLIITKFDSTSLNWFCFWNQFDSEIDKAEIDPVSKFSYLKELLIPRVRSLIDVFPLTSEGYSRLKFLLSMLNYYLAVCFSKFTSKLNP